MEGFIFRRDARRSLVCLFIHRIYFVLKCCLLVLHFKCCLFLVFKVWHTFFLFCFAWVMFVFRLFFLWQCFGSVGATAFMRAGSSSDISEVGFGLSVGVKKAMKIHGCCGGYASAYQI